MGTQLLAALDKSGFVGAYDFIYLPHSFDTQKNYGYSFINFIDGDVAERFLTEFADFSDWGIATDSKAVVSWTTGSQGLAAHVERYRNSPFMHESFADELK